MAEQLKLDCYHAALPDEPRFTLLARDPAFAWLVRQWADRREVDILCGERPASDREQVVNARALAVQGAEWRHDNMGKWREEALPPIEVSSIEHAFQAILEAVGRSYKGKPYESLRDIEYIAMAGLKVTQQQKLIVQKIAAEGKMQVIRDAPG